MARKPATRILAATLAFFYIVSGCTPSSDISTQALSRTVIQQTSVTPSRVETYTTRALDQYFLPTYYPDTYQKIIDASKRENGIIIYSNLGEDVWKPVIDSFKGHFPWIEITIHDLGANEVFDRYLTEIAQGEGSADLVASYSPEGWIDFANEGFIEPYLSEEDFYIPPWTKQAPGIYTIASDPLVIVYNKENIKAPPQGMKDIANLVEENLGQVSGKITSYDATQNSTGEAVNWFWTEKMGQVGWEMLKKIGESHPTFKTSSSSMVESIINGDNLIGYFISPVSFLPLLDKYPNIGWSYIKDGQPILMRSIAITKQAHNPNSAKLMLDYLLSQEGQLALALGGMTAFRSDIANVGLFTDAKESRNHIHFNQVIEAVGLENLIFINLDPRVTDAALKGAFVEHWIQSMDK